MTLQHTGDSDQSPHGDYSGTVLGVTSSIGPVVYRIQKFLYEHPLVYGFWYELRSFLHRIRLLYKRRAIGHAYTGRLFLKNQDQELIVNTTSRGRIQGIEKLLEYQHWASPEDRRLFLFAWELGRRWGVVHLDRAGEEPIDTPETWQSIIGN